MTIPTVKAKYGDRLSLIGGVCNITTLLSGSKQDNIERQVASIAEVARHGGIVIGAHSLDGDIPLENFDYYNAVLEKYDRLW